MKTLAVSALVSLSVGCLAQSGGHWKIDVLPDGYTSCSGLADGVPFSWPFPDVGYWGETPDGEKTDLYTCLPVSLWDNSTCRLNGSGTHSIRLTWVNSSGQPTTVGCPATVQVRLWSNAGYSWIEDYPPFGTLNTGTVGGTGDNGLDDPFVETTTVVGNQYLATGRSYGAKVLRLKPQGGVINLTTSQSFNCSVSNFGNLGRFAATGGGGADIDNRDVIVSPATGGTYRAEITPGTVTWDGVSLAAYEAVANELPHAGESGRADIGLNLITNAAVLLPEQYQIKQYYVGTRIGPAPTTQSQHPYTWSTSFGYGAGTYQGASGGQIIAGPLSGSLIDNNSPSPYNIPNMFVTYIHPYVMNWGIMGYSESDGHAGQTDAVSLSYTWTEDSAKAVAKLQVKLHKEIEDKLYYKTIPDSAYVTEVFNTSPEWTPPASTLPPGSLTPIGTAVEAPIWNSVFVNELRAFLGTAALVVPAGKLVTAMKLLGVALPLIPPATITANINNPSQADFNAALQAGRVGAGCTDITDSAWKAHRRTWYDSDLYRVLAYNAQGYSGMEKMGIERRNRREWLYFFQDWSAPGNNP